MNKRIIYLFIGLIVSIVFYFAFTNYQSNPDRLFARLKQQLKEEKFEEIYDESSDMMHLNDTKEQFVERMKIAVIKLKAIDENLDFQRDKEMERRMGEITERDDSILIGTIQKLEKNNKSVSVIIWWRNQGLFPKFFDLSVHPNNDTSKDFSVRGILYKE